MINLTLVGSFDWDAGNARKNEKHGVSQSESEQVFFNDPLLMLQDLKHASQELRFHALGKTDANRLLHVTFTLRFEATKIRVISACDMRKKERHYYDQASK